MMKNIILLFLSTFTSGFEILKGINRTSLNIEYHLCNTTDQRLYDVSKKTIAYINSYNIFNLFLNENQRETPGLDHKNVICYVPPLYSYMAGYCTPFQDSADVFISKRLTQTTMYNVMLHEIVHSIGLNHTSIPSIMNYKVHSYFPAGYTNYEYVEDTNELYLSLDDVKGLRHLRRCIKNN